MKIMVNEKEYGSKALGITIAVVAIVLVATASIFYAAGSNAGVDSAAVSALAEVKEKNDSELNAKKQELEATKLELSQNKQTIDAMNEYKTNKSNLDKEISDKTSTLEQLNGEISSKQGELDLLTGQVAKAIAEPKTLSAGQFVVGTDLPAGRYNVSGSSNFIVHSAYGDLKVNTILGYSGVGRGDYICTLSNGDQMQLNAQTTFTPIQ